MLPGWKKEIPWLAECGSIALQQVLHNFDRPWQNYFKFPDHFNGPIAKHRLSHDSFCVVGPAAAKTERNRIWLPKHGWLSFRNSRPWQGKITSYTISRKADRWYVSLQCKVEAATPPVRTDPWVGIDVGIARYATVSDDSTHMNGVRAYKTHQRKLARMQRAFARCERGSNRRYKMGMCIAQQACRRAVAGPGLDASHVVTGHMQT